MTLRKLWPIVGCLACAVISIGMAAAQDFKLEGNWKLVLETFLESYHFNYAHRDNLATYYHGNCNTVDKMGKHLRKIGRAHV